jgi:transposase
VPAVPSCILDPLREEFLALLPPHVDDHPLGCHRRRIPDAVVFDKLVEALVFDAGYERIADATCSATTLRRRRDEWIRLGVFDRLRLVALDAYNTLIGLDLADLCVDGCITKAPCGGECAGRSPVDRGKQGLKRSTLTEGGGIPLAAVPAAANIRDDALLGPTLDALKDFAPLPAGATVHLDAGYDYRPCREALAERGLNAEITPRGVAVPIQAGRRWVIERDNAWLNDFGRLRCCPERRRACVEAFLALAIAIVTVRALLREAWRRYRWDARPRSPRIR